MNKLSMGAIPEHTRPHPLPKEAHVGAGAWEEISGEKKNPNPTKSDWKRPPPPKKRTEYSQKKN